MSRQDIAGLACKILGLYMIIQGINVMANVLIFNWASPNQLIPISSVLSSFILLFIFGILLWGCSDRLSAFMAGGTVASKEGADSAITPNDVQRIAFSVLGLYFLGNSLPSLLSVLSSLLTLNQVGLSQQVLTTMARPIIEFLVGLGIFFGSQGLVNLLNSLRAAGVKKEYDPEDE
jgi:hypothetical protein